jgi:hypothetical protein
MALDANIRGSTSGTGVEVTSLNHLKVTTETNVEANPNNVGAIRFFSENDAGSITGTPYLQAPECSDDYRLRVGMDSLLFDKTFSEITTLDTSTMKLPIVPDATMTITSVSGFITLNAGQASLVSGNKAAIQTQRYFRVRATSPLYVEITGNLTVVPITNQVFEAGIFLNNAGNQPQDGIWFQVTSAGVIGVLAYNGSITQTGVLLPPESLPIANNGTYLLVINSSYVEFWIDDVLYGEVYVPAGQATPFLTDSLPVTIQARNVGTVSAVDQASIRIGDIGVTAGDIASNRSWAAQMSGMGQHCSQGQAGGTMGSTAAYPNATAATTVTGSALSQTAPIVTGLGGQAGIIAAVPGIDGIIYSFQNPVGSVTQPPRNLAIFGIRISATNIGAAAGASGSVLSWSLGYGSTAIGLATAEVATLAAATVKGYRRIPLGLTGIPSAAAIGYQAGEIYAKFDAPITVLPGEFVAVTAKFIAGLATASQVIWTTCMIDGHFD